MKSTSSSSVTKTDQGMAITGKLVFANINDMVDKSKQYLIQNQTSAHKSEFVIDCAAMQRIDSAGIALLIEWQRQCVKKKISCHFVGLSKQAQSLIHAYRLQSLINA